LSFKIAAWSEAADWALLAAVISRDYRWRDVAMALERGGQALTELAYRNLHCAKLVRCFVGPDAQGICARDFSFRIKANDLLRKFVEGRTLLHSNERSARLHEGPMTSIS
jgi:hypothetical protein